MKGFLPPKLKGFFPRFTTYVFHVMIVNAKSARKSMIYIRNVVRSGPWYVQFYIFASKRIKQAISAYSGKKSTYFFEVQGSFPCFILVSFVRGVELSELRTDEPRMVFRNGTSNEYVVS